MSGARGSRTLFDADLNSPAYHLALDAHPEIGNDALLGEGARRRGGGARSSVRDRRQAAPRLVTLERLLSSASAGEINPEAARLPAGPTELRRSGDRVLQGSNASTSPEGGRRGLRLLPDRRARGAELSLAKEARDQFVAAGHHATEKLGVKALTERIADRFDLEWEFIDLPNPV